MDLLYALATKDHIKKGQPNTLKALNVKVSLQYVLSSYANRLHFFLVQSNAYDVINLLNNVSMDLTKVSIVKLDF